MVDRRDPGSRFLGVAEQCGALPTQFPFNAYVAPTPARGAGSSQKSQTKSGRFCCPMPQFLAPIGPMRLSNIKGSGLVRAYRRRKP
jgi:hypothetical protein